LTPAITLRRKSSGAAVRSRIPGPEIAEKIAEMIVSCSRRRWSCRLALVAVLGSILPAVAAENAFPFDRELVLDASPMRGSKRIPILQFDERGAVSIDLWCASVQGQATVGADAITIVPGAADAGQCTPERAQRDADLLAALSQVTTWRRSGGTIELVGPTKLRFRLMTN
jgi:heat shock protein HslJ